jgi:phospholipid transport system substrate-binding protein
VTERRWFRQRGAVALPLVLLVLCCTGAAAPGDGATATVRDALQKATAVSSTDQPREQQLEGLRLLARGLVDTKAMGQRALGGTYAERTPAEQQEFLRLFDELIVRAYLQKLLLFRNPTFRFRPEARDGDTVMVVSEVVTGRDTYEVGYAMRHDQQRWLATDIVVEGISLSGNYADQFASALKSRSFEELLDLMRRKVDHFRTLPTAK